MKRRLRLCLYLLLCLVLPVNGMAGARVLAEPCPMLMQHGDEAMMAMAAGADDDCQGEHHSMPSGGHLCKDGHLCKSSSPFQVVSVGLSLLTPAQPVPAHLPRALPPVAPEPVWHPPRA